MARKATGQLIRRATGWYARITTTIEGERVRVMRDLGTQTRPVAVRRLERLLASDAPAAEDAARPETFSEACERIYGERVSDAGENAKEPKQALSQLRRVAYPVLETMPVTKI